MEALNKGAAEAGGTSIGALLSKLPGEQGQTGNAYLTTRRFHPNFPPRKADLRDADYHLLFKGGVGSLDELFDKSANVQTGKEPDGPIYVVGSKLYENTLKQMDVLVKNGLAAKSDRDRLVPADDVRWIISDIKHREAQKAAAQNGEAVIPSVSSGSLSKWLSSMLRPVAR
jgi:predicted Rossmann-fold nucleotide-binding protein